MHFKDQDSGSGAAQSQANRSIVTALYAEVIGVLAMTRFQSVRRRFMQEYKENQNNSRALVNIIMGLKFIRIKVSYLAYLGQGGAIFLIMNSSVYCKLDNINMTSSSKPVPYKT